jgi:hypothetical protein
MAAFADTTGQNPYGQTGTPTTTKGRVTSDRAQTESQVTLVGCIQREADYRKEHSSGRGGPVGTGAGLKNEYVLINASKSTEADTSDMSCTGNGEAYELTGKRERELARFVGRRIEITGTLKPAKTSPQTGKPTGGFDPLGQDLELFEVNVASFRPIGASRATEPEPESAAQAVTPAEPEAQQPIGTAGAQEALPRTASPLALSGLIGLLSLGGALGVRSLRRR